LGLGIEQEKIEAALLSIPGIAQCTVLARHEDKAKQLVVYLVASTGLDALPLPKSGTQIESWITFNGFVILQC
jgi:acyl-coenzyme A synthetase/AMP-(fatty) acid ligase